MKVMDAMTEKVITIRPEASLKEAAAIFAEHGIGGLPVVDHERRLLGVITEADILLKEQPEAPRRGLGGFFHRREATALAVKVHAHRVGEAMTMPVLTAAKRWPISVAATLMIEQGVNRLPVVEGEQLVGIITRHDLVRAFARPDLEIEEDIRRDALRGISWAERLQLTVRDGEVTMRGEVDSVYDAQALPDVVRRIPGVVGVDSELTAWDGDKMENVQVTARRD